jgi:hypothetical protein
MKVTTEQTGGRWSMVDYTANPGMQTILHRHRVTDETFSVLEGELTMSINGSVHTLHPGATGSAAIRPSRSISALSDIIHSRLTHCLADDWEKLHALAGCWRLNCTLIPPEMSRSLGS